MEFFIISLASFLAGCVDAIVGGGGLILVPALFATFPGAPPATLFGTNKGASIWGTAFATHQFSQRVRMNWSVLLPAAASGFVASLVGAWGVTLISAEFLRKILTAVLLLVLVYTLILWSVIGLMFWSLAHRAPFKVDVERDRATLSREVDGGMIENVFRLQIMNASEQAQRVHIQADGLDGLKVVTDTDLVIDAAQSRWVVVRLQVPVESVKPGSHPIHFEVDGQDSKAVVIEKTVFIVPR